MAQETLWVIGGYGDSSSNIMSSVNLTDWTNSGNLGLTGNSGIYDIVWNGSLYVAVGDGDTGVGCIFTSTDGVEWVDRGNPFGGQGLRCILYDSGTWRIYGTGTTANSVTSTDGITWTPGALDAAANTFSCVAKSGSVYVAASPGYAGNTVYSSTDGSTWVGRGAPVGTGRRVVWNGQKFVLAGGQNNSISNSAIATSTDGTAWVQCGNPLGHVESVIGGLAWNGTIWVAGDSYGGNKMIYSTDGSNWLQSNDLFSSQSNDWFGCWVISTDGEEFVAAGSGGVSGLSSIYTSMDGISWTSHGTNPVAPQGQNGWILAVCYSTMTTSKKFEGFAVLFDNIGLYPDKPSLRAGSVITHVAKYDYTGFTGLHNLYGPTMDTKAYLHGVRVHNSQTSASKRYPIGVVLNGTLVWTVPNSSGIDTVNPTYGFVPGNCYTNPGDRVGIQMDFTGFGNGTMTLYFDFIVLS